MLDEMWAMCMAACPHVLRHIALLECSTSGRWGMLMRWAEHGRPAPNTALDQLPLHWQGDWRTSSGQASPFAQIMASTLSGHITRACAASAGD